MSRKDTRIQTRNRRKTLSCKTYQIKVDMSKVSNYSITHLNMLFLEAKWLYNDILSSTDIFNYNTKINKVNVKYPTKIELKPLDHISSQMKQGITHRIYDNVKGLSQSKNKGRKVGKLKFISRINSIPLKQHKCTYTINFEKDYIKLQGLKAKIKVNGLNQINQKSEIASANLIKISKDFFFSITTYEEVIEKIVPDKAIGIDFGCTTQLILSDGMKINYEVPISSSIKQLDKKIARSRKANPNKKTKNYFKLLEKREKQYNKLNNKKKDIKNKIVNYLSNNFKYVIFQDESVNAWKAGKHGKKIQNTAISGIISSLRSKAHTPIEVGKFFPSTQLCNFCGNKQKLDVSVRIYECQCGKSLDRDLNRSINILNEGVKVGKIPAECKEFKPLENVTSVTNIFGNKNIIYKYVL